MRITQVELTEEFYNRFPENLKNKLLSKEIELPSTAQIEYDPIKAYRAVKRKKDDCSPVNSNDFKSYYELGQNPKKAKGIDHSKNPNFYGVSFYLKKEIVAQIMKFPNPRKKMAVGYIFPEGGPQETNKKSLHVCWWLFKNVDLSNFKILEE